MSLDKSTVARIAQLARIAVPDDQLDALAGELNNILGWVEQLSEVDTENVAPLASVTAQQLPWRRDEVTDGGIADKVTGSAPDSSGPFFTVPKVVE